MFLNTLPWRRKDVHLFPQPKAEGSFRSRGLDFLLEKLSGKKNAVLLDFGNGCSGSLEVLSGAAKRVVFAGLSEKVEDIPLLGIQQNGALEEKTEPAVLPSGDKSAGSAGSQEQYDAVLCWDIFDYVSDAEAPAIVEHIHSATQDGAFVHVMIGTVHRHSYKPSIFEFKTPIEVSYHADLTKMVDCPRHSIRKISNLFKGFQPLHIGLLRHGYYELLFRRTA